MTTRGDSSLLMKPDRERIVPRARPGCRASAISMRWRVILYMTKLVRQLLLDGLGDVVDIVAVLCRHLGRMVDNNRVVGLEQDP